MRRVTKKILFKTDRNKLFSVFFILKGFAPPHGERLFGRKAASPFSIFMQGQIFFLQKPRPCAILKCNITIY